MVMASAYPSYRQPKMRWLPTVPEHWNEQRAKTFFREVDERSKTGQEELLSVSHLTGVTPRSQKNVTMFKAASYVGSKLCRPGDIVINTLWAWMGALGASRHVGIVSPAYGVYRPHHADSFNPAYLDYLLRTRAYVAEYIGRSTGIRASRLRLYPNQFLDIALIQPPRPEQDQIVAYLRAQDAHIARFIKAKRDLIKLLTEQKLRIIDHAVTRGVDAAVALKPSGIEWLGEVPEHWEVSKVKLLADYINGFPFKPAEWGAKGRPIIRIQNLTKEHAAFNYYDGAIPERNHVKDGDILLSWSASLGVFVWNRGDAWLNQHIFKVVPDPKRITRGYFVWLARWFLNHMEAEAHGSTMQHITKPKFGSFPVPLPSLSEQVEIEAHINRETQDIDLAIARTEEEIKLIREYRDRLIADVVTGQVDVRGWQPGPDDVVDDAALAALGDEQEDVTEEEEGDGED
ncbi:restriction endonuclease subunit S [Pseudomonas aeruginosa]|uniref:restriction endonuclease subunit S n=1 Tax=Pseudomonas aeruginosa TaxID=287 RepID=UPI0039792921